MTRLALALTCVLVACLARAHELPCDDGRDNDFDGAADCEDPDCAFFPGCEETDCADGLDENHNGYADCDDPSCYSYPGCLNFEDCGNGVDDDGDGFVDCDDAGCALQTRCQFERCQNGQDDDFDGLIDCLDDDCFGLPPCIPEDCGNGVDDDGDFLVDCTDSDCAGIPACAGLAVNRRVALTPWPSPSVESQFCSRSPPIHVCPELVVAGILDGMRLAGEAAASGTDALRFYEHSDAVETMHVRRDGDDLVFGSN